MPALRYALLFFALGGVLVQPAEAQQRSGRGGPPTGAIIGTVVDDAGGPVPTSSVAVWRVPQPNSGRDTSLVTGTITEVDGTFRIDGVPPGRFIVDVSHVGYVSTRIEDVRVDRQSRTADLGDIVLAADVEQLDGVEVQAQRQNVEIQIDRTVYDTANDPVAASGTATTVLETIPSVEVDIDGNVSLRGSGNVAILINGRPAPVSGEFLASYLQQLPAGVIERVEVIPNPSARYEPDGMSGIINLVLKENTDLGLGGSLSVGGDSRGGYDATGTLTYGKGPWNLSASYGFRQRERNADGASFRINRYLDPVTAFDQDETDDNSGTSHSATLAVDYALTKRTTLSVQGQVSADDEAEAEVNTFAVLDADNVSTFAYERLVDGSEEGASGDARLGLRHDFGGQGTESHTLSAEARFNASTEDETEAYLESLLSGTGTLRPDQRTTTDDARREVSLQVDYVRPLAGFRFEAGYKGDLQRRDSDFRSETRDAYGVFVNDIGLSNVFDFEEQIHAGYLQAGREFGDLGVQLGVRLESAQTDFTLENTGETYANDYTSVFPSAFLTYELNEANTIKASYSRRINRPNPWFLNPFPSFDDPDNIRVGNPRLRPEYVNSFEVGYVRYAGWGSVTLTPYFRRTTDVIRRVVNLRDDGVAERTSVNLDTSDSYGVELIGAFEFGGALDGLRGFASVEGYRVQSSGVSNDTDLQNDAFGWGGRLNTTYRLGNRTGLGDLTLQANVFYRAPMDVEQGRIGSRTFLNFALRQALLNDRASLTLRANDPFGLAGFSFELDQPDLYQDFERRWGAQSVGLTFQYTFGQQQRQRRDRERGDGDGDFGGEEF